MDKRVVKTKRDIKVAYMDLRQKTPLEKMRVNHLCEIALINKSTFYTYYDNIYDLSNEIENTIVNTIIEDFDCIGCLFNHPERFIDGMMYSIRLHTSDIKTVFSDNINGLVNKIEERLKGYYSSQKNTPQKDILISFLIGGATRVMLNSNCDEQIVKKTLVDLLTHDNAINHY